MAELKEGQKLKRQIKVYGIEQPVIVTMTREGLSFKVKGTKIEVMQTWQRVVVSCDTPTNVPSWLHGKPLQLLEHLSKQSTKRKIKRAGGAA
jgi:hypothetical protein